MTLPTSSKKRFIRPTRKRALPGYLDDWMHRLRERIPPAMDDFDGDAIHDARVASRRLTAAVELLQPVLSKKPRKAMAKALKRLRRQLGTMRDIDVTLTHLVHLEKRANPDASAWLRHHLLSDQIHARQKAHRRLDAKETLQQLADWETLRPEVIKANDAVPALLATSVQDQLAIFNHSAALLGHEGKKTPENDPHQLRIAGKRLRYTLELAQAAGRRLPPDVPRTFRRIQKALGAWHDLVVLAETVMRLSADHRLAHHDTALQEHVLALAGRAVRQAETHLQRVRDLWARDGTHLMASLDQLFPLLPAPPLIESQTDPDPADLQETQRPAVPSPADRAAG